MNEALPITKAREAFSEIVNQAMYSKTRTIITKHDKPAVAIVPYEDLELLMELEARFDLEDAREALKEAGEKGTVAWEEVKDELDL